jgi:hypothetical protein
MQFNINNLEDFLSVIHHSMDRRKKDVPVAVDQRKRDRRSKDRNPNSKHV